MSEAMRFNEGKPELDYMHTWHHALCEVAKVCQKGGEKYDVGNYLLGQNYRQLLSAAGRHIGKFGHHQLDDYDEESHCHHLAHAIWNLLQLLQLEVGPPVSPDGGTNARFDNRIRPPVTGVSAWPPSTVIAANTQRSEALDDVMRQRLQQIDEEEDNT